MDFSLHPVSFRRDNVTKKIFILIIMLVISAVSPALAKTKEINVALWKLPFNVPAMVAVHDKSYEKAFAGEYKVNYVQLPSGPKQIQAIAAGNLDIAEGIGAAAALVGKANGVDITIVGANSRSPHAFAILTNDPNIKTAADLKGKKAAGLRGSVVHQLFIELLEKNRLSENDIEFFPMPLAAATSTLLANRVDVALLVGTEIKRAQSGGARILADGQGYVDGLSVIAVRTAFLKDNPGTVEKYLKTRETIRKELISSPDKFVELIAKEAGLSQTETKDMINIYDFNTKITERDVKELGRTLNYLQKQKMIRSIPSINEIIWNKSFK